MSQHDDDCGLVCPKCGITFDCHEMLSPECDGGSELDEYKEQDGEE